MDDLGAIEREDAGPDVVKENRYFVLALSDAGWGVWRRGRLTGDPVVLHPPGDDGLDLASRDFARLERTERSRRGPWLDVLRWGAIVSGAVWVIGTAFFVYKLTLAPDSLDPEADFNFIKWWEAAAQVAQPLFFVNVGAYVILWLRAR